MKNFEMPHPTPDESENSSIESKPSIVQPALFRSRSRSLLSGNWEIHKEEMTIMSPSSLSYYSDEEITQKQKKRNSSAFDQLLREGKFLSQDSDSVYSMDSRPDYFLTDGDESDAVKHNTKAIDRAEYAVKDRSFLSIPSQIDHRMIYDDEGYQGSYQQHHLLSSKTLKRKEATSSSNSKYNYSYDDFFRAIIIFGAYMMFLRKSQTSIFWRIVKMGGIFALCYLEAISSTRITSSTFSISLIPFVLSKMRKSIKSHKKAAGSSVVELLQPIHTIIFSRKTTLLLVYVMVWIIFCDTIHDLIVTLPRGLKMLDQYPSDTSSLINTCKTASPSNDVQSSKMLTIYNKAGGIEDLVARLYEKSIPVPTKSQRPPLVILSKSMYFTKNNVFINPRRGSRDCESEFRTLLQKARDSGHVSNTKEEIKENDHKSKTWIDNIGNVVHKFVSKAQKFFFTAIRYGTYKDTLNILYEIWMRGGIS